MDKKRQSGILLPISSLPSKYGIGCFSKEAYAFVDALKEAGQAFWQILPLGPTSYGDSPYQSFSTFAGNPYFISLEDLIEEGVLTKEDCSRVNLGTNPAYVDYGKLFEGRYELLKKAFANTDLSEDEEYTRFVEEEAFWLDDYALYMAIKTERFDNKSWIEWAEDIRRRWDYSLDYYKGELKEEIGFWKYLQYKFLQQWKKLKAYANEKGIHIIGDIPIYVAMDSADTWASPWLFKLQDSGEPTLVAGCPPDGFSATGQLWGNPIYNWEVHKKSGYDWWVKRVEHCFTLYDVLRIDHFRGFDEFYEIPYGDESAVNGWWTKGPGIDLFRVLKERLGEKAIIAEDLGYMTDSVKELVKESGYPNMKVLEFAFDERDTGNANDYLPHNYDRNCVVYTGTHDNETLAGWLKSITPAEKRKLLAYFQLPSYATDERICKELIRAAVSSVAWLAIIPIQDYLGLDNKARMNHPSTLGGNWEWRLLPGQFSKKVRTEIKNLSQLYGRL
ncbi:MAG: 4-alpha-glucanotransferase [Blautia sp.]|nr:4-alpha-glucanotransferase [Blautia sp.]